ncbi:MAG: agmatinase [Nitrososphaerota archaeon]|jgi:agmatinase|nr:agmatinase [Nitrososphaerota archaeon]MDG6932898.1 agmatinase [Nitrososphaerota archaeon]MDG6936365.1 agmatinase [Nitrososphaerota archaeon]MDG6944364.1 agmatinase [Nitrososphaerota archaeon]
MSYTDLYTNDSPKISTGGKDSPIYVLGIPFDFTSSYRPGSRFGPDSVRQAYWNIEIVDRELGVNAENIPIFDLGNISPVTSVDGMIDMVRKVSGEAFAQGKVLGSIGGEHLITLPIASNLKDASIVVFDAHFDLRDELYGLKVSHATFFRRLLESKQIKAVHAGAHAYLDDELQSARNLGVRVITQENLRNDRRSLLDALPDGPLYISVDTDVLDPSCAPGVGNPEPGGLAYSELFDALRSLKGRKIVGFDVNEVSPPYDPSGITSIAAAKVFSILVILSWVGING